MGHRGGNKMIVEIQRNETEFMTIDLSKVDDEDIADEARERDYIVMEKQPFQNLYEKVRRGENIDEQLRELFLDSLGRLVC
jgi:hypothetical protein